MIIVKTDSVREILYKELNTNPKGNLYDKILPFTWSMENPTWKPIKQIEDFVSRLGVNIVFCDKEGIDPESLNSFAQYMSCKCADPDCFAKNPLINDSIVFSSRGIFKSAKDYYAALFHEIGHWAGGPDRLDRVKVTDRQEEAVAELSAAMLGERFGILDANKSLHAGFFNGYLASDEYKKHYPHNYNAKEIIDGAYVGASEVVDFLFKIAMGDQ